MITTKLFDEVLIKPAINGADKLLIVSGYATSAMAFHHLEQLKNLNKNINIELVVGMTIQDGISLSNHKGFQKLVEDDFADGFICSYISSRPPVHSKVYIWLKDEKSIVGFAGSANYTQTAFLRKQREILTECDSSLAFDYFHELIGDTIYCTHIDAENIVQI